MNRRTLAASAFLVGFTILPTHTEQVVEIRLRGHYFAEPATVQVLVQVEPDQANRRLRIEADGERMFRSTELPLQGDADKRIHTVEFKNLAAGSYTLRAEVLSTEGVRGVDARNLFVAGR